MAIPALQAEFDVYGSGSYRIGFADGEHGKAPGEVFYDFTLNAFFNKVQGEFFTLTYPTSPNLGGGDFLAGMLNVTGGSLVNTIGNWVKSDTYHESPTPIKDSPGNKPIMPPLKPMNYKNQKDPSKYFIDSKYKTKDSHANNSASDNTNKMALVLSINKY